ncbi:hypothetical protein P692DRAFT_20837430 [Suillus brevipes Sb2]|nr:hypothetical protein P692DRAFT_20837430 [Suillus brevipes Sb2]
MLTSKCASWEPNSNSFWDNQRRVILPDTRLSLPPFDFWPQTRHALRGSPHGEKPVSVEQHERRTGKSVTKVQTIVASRQKRLSVSLVCIRRTVFLLKTFRSMNLEKIVETTEG